MLARRAAVDKHIGQIIRTRRISLGMTLEDLGDKVELTLQQISKYEIGAAVSGGRLDQIAAALKLSPGDFFPPGGAEQSMFKGLVSTHELSSLVNRPDTIKLLRAFACIPGKNDRAQVIDFVETAARHLTSWASRHNQLFCW